MMTTIEENMVRDAAAHLHAAAVQSCGDDDPMIIGHINAALAILRAVLTPPDRYSLDHKE